MLINNIKISEEEIRSALSSFTDLYSSEVEKTDSAFKITLKNQSKKILITWPIDISEVFFDFFDNEEKIFHEWLECMEVNDKNIFIEFAISIPKKYLEHETKVITEGKLLKIKKLVYFSGHCWVDIFE